MATLGELMTSAEILALPGDRLVELCRQRPREVVEAVLRDGRKGLVGKLRRLGAWDDIGALKMRLRDELLRERNAHAKRVVKSIEARQRERPPRAREQQPAAAPPQHQGTGLFDDLVPAW